MRPARDILEEAYPEIISVAPGTRPMARALERLLGSGAYDGARLVECRVGSTRFPDACLLVLDVEVGLGQRRPVNDIRTVERVGFAYTRVDEIPVVCPMREDFPTDVPHLNLAGRHDPRTLCLFEMPPEEAFRLATPHVLVERVRFWVGETAHGRLHGEDQPLDPAFTTVGHALVLPPPSGQPGEPLLHTGWRVSDRKGAPVLLATGGVAARRGSGGRQLAVVSVVTRPLRHARLRMVPFNLAELLVELEDMGADALDGLRASLHAIADGPDLRQLAACGTIFMVDCPVERTPGVIGRIARKAFLTETTLEAVADRLGAFHMHEGFPARPLGKPAVNMDALSGIALYPLDVHGTFDRHMARAARGAASEAAEPRPVVLAGAGALGSQVAMTAARMGFGVWTVIDPDHLLPHNMARHALSPAYVGFAKADALAAELCGLLGPEAATATVARVEDRGDAAWSGDPSALVIDATASVPSARWLALDSGHPAVTSSVFLSPSGSDLVMLTEGEGRMPRLDHVEMSYYWMLAGDAGLEGHLSAGTTGMYPSGGCRQPSLAISQADVGTLAPLAARHLFQPGAPPDGSIQLFRSSRDGVSRVERTPCRFADTAVGKWTVSVSQEVRDGILADRRDAAHLETGGILVGSWDRARQQVYVVGRYAPPPDSVASRTGFIRGAAGVFETIETVERRTTRNLTYIGEWHTHPVGCASTPSGEDAVLLRNRPARTGRI